MAASISLLAAATIAATMTSSQCGEIVGFESLQQHESQRFFVFGERHGTQEIPRMFGEAVCIMSAHSPILVGLEIDHTQAESISIFLTSDGSAQSREALLDNSHWTIRDGRASQAMLDLLMRLRELRASGRDIEVIPFMLPGNTPEEREHRMAESLIAGLAARPEARVAALIGSAHAGRESFGGIEPTAAYLPRENTVTLRYVPWEICRRSFGCSIGITDPKFRILTTAPPEWRWPSFDLWYAVGQPFTASPPAHEANVP